MSARRDRPPSGRTNVHSARPSTAHSFGNSTISSFRDRPTSASGSARGALNSERRERLFTPSQSSPNLLPVSSNNQPGIASTQPSPRKERPKTAAPVPSSSADSARLRPTSAGPETASARSHLSVESELSTGEVLRRMREKSEMRRRAIESAEIDALGDYNAFSRPRPSSVAPLRSVLLDPEVNNFPKSRTRSELMKRIRYANMPHPSYDLDNDGYVSTDDYKLAKRFDFDGNGVLDPDERNIGERDYCCALLYVCVCVQ